MKKSVKGKDLNYLELVIVVIGILIFFSFSIFQGVTGKIVENQIENSYSHTKAICDGKGYCEDYFIECSDEKLVSLTPTGFAIQTDENWKDPRDEDTINRLC